MNTTAQQQERAEEQHDRLYCDIIDIMACDGLGAVVDIFAAAVAGDGVDPANQPALFDLKHQLHQWRERYPRTAPRVTIEPPAVKYWAPPPPGAVAYKQACSLSGPRFILSSYEARTIEQIDPSLIVWLDDETTH